MFECLSDCFHSHNSWDGLNRHYYSGTYTAVNEDNTSETRFGFTKEETWQAIRQAWIFIEMWTVCPTWKLLRRSV